jgi:TRAP-type C4-dicarboxylate transport system permease small subunit
MRRPWWKFALGNGVETIAVAAAVIFIVLIFLQVLFRYLFQSPISWSEELIMLFFQWSIFLGAAISIRSGAHFRLNFLTRYLSPRVDFYVDIFGILVMAAVAFTLLIKGWAMVVLTRNSTFATINVSRAFSYLAIPASGALMIIYLIPIFIDRVASRKRDQK